MLKQDEREEYVEWRVKEGQKLGLVSWQVVQKEH